MHGENILRDSPRCPVCKKVPRTQRGKEHVKREGKCFKCKYGIPVTTKYGRGKVPS